MNPLLGLFDSGMGGLTVLNSLQERHSNINAIYLADTARLPYGVKNSSEIRKIASEIAQWLDSQHIQALVVACNTTNSLALDVLKKYSTVPVFDLIGATSEFIQYSRIGVLATPSTVTSRAYSRQIFEVNPYAHVVEESCPEFVPMIEAGTLDYSKIKDIAKRHLHPLLEANSEAIVLGCSHYPLIKSIFLELLPAHVHLIDPSIYLAKKLDSFLGQPSNSVNSPKSLVDIQFCVTSNPFDFSSKVSHWLGVRPEVEVISLLSKTCVF